MKKIFLIIAGLGVTSSVVLTNVQLSNEQVSQHSRSVDFQQMYVVGDSLSDSGALVGLGSQLLKEILGQEEGLILGDPFYLHRSFSNGRVAAEVLAEQLDLSLTPAWKFNFLSNNFEHLGNNYAVVGAQASETESIKGMLLNNFTISKQVDALLAQHSLTENDLTFFEIGSNDLMFQILNVDAMDKKESIIATSVTNQKNALEKLITHGAKQILVMNTPDLGRTPSYQNKKTEASQLSAEYNQVWNNMISNLQKHYPHTLKVFNLYEEFPELLAAFAATGGNIAQGAVNYSLDADTILAGKIMPKYNEGVTSETINNHFFFDFVHPTEPVHNTVGAMLYQIVNSQW